MSLVSDVQSLVLDPDGFFQREAASPAFREPALVVLVVSLVNVLSSLLLVSHVDFSGQNAAIADTVFGISATFGILFGIVGVFVLWLTYTAVFYALTALADGAGSFRNLFRLVGWGYVPSLVGGILSVGTTWYVLQTLPRGLEAQAYLQQYQTHPAFTVVGVASLAILVWQWFIWVFAIRHARSVTLTRAAVIAALPVGINIAWNVSSLL